MNKSPAGTLTASKLKAIGRGALVAMGGALATYVAGELSLINWSTIGHYGFVIAPIAGIAINFLRKWATDHTK